MATLIDVPRPANASPNPRRFVLIASRVGSSNMFTNSSNSTGCGSAAASGSVAPSVKPSRERPRVISTYFRPSAERVRMRTFESSGSGLTWRSSLRASTATVEPSRRRSAVIDSTVPTRAPPMRTSLPRTRLAALGTCALSE